MEETLPTTTSLYLTSVLPASKPAAVWKLMVIWGPIDSHAWITIDTPMSAATSGTNQTSETGHRRRVTNGSRGCEGFVLSSVSLTIALVVPDQSRIEADGRQHGEDHHRAEKENAYARLGAAQRLELHQRGD